MLSAARILAGFLAPWFLPAPLAAASVVVGDLLDRCEYYDELEIPTPDGQLERDLRERLKL